MSQRKPESPIAKALEYAIFSNNPVHVYLDQNDKQVVRLRVTDIFPDSFEGELTLDLPVHLQKKLDENSTIKMSIEYKRQIFVFDTTRIRSESNRHIFLKPTIASLNNRREFPRFGLSDSSTVYEVELTVEGTGERTTYRTNHVCDISPTALSIFLPRDHGVVLPGDDVTKITLKLKDAIVLETEGKILRVNTSDKERMQNHYLAVVSLNNSQLNAVPATFDKDRRRATRAYLLEQKSAFVYSKHPLCSDFEIKGPIVDISKSGMSFLALASKAPLVSGMFIPQIEIQLPMYPREIASARVVSCNVVTEGDDKHLRVQCKFEAASPTLLKSISQVIQAQVQPNVEDATSEDYDQLWEFMFETGFIYGDKRKQIQEYATKTFNTYKKLLKGNSPIVKKILFKDKTDESIRGHISAIRFYDNAWLIQHLNALKSKDSASAAQGVLTAITEFFKDHHANKMRGHNFVTCFYRPDNLYPTIVFGEAKKYINNIDICDTEDFDFCLLAEKIQSAPPISLIAGLNCREATEKDLHHLEDLLIEKKRFKELRVEGLTASGATNLNVSKSFEEMGLYRFRRVFVASDENDGNAIFAVCNYGSPGLNLSELTNSFRLFCTSEESAIQQRLADFVVPDVLKSYQETELTRPTLLLQAAQPTPMQYTRSRVYRHWIMNTAHVPLFKIACDQTFANLKELVHKYMNENAKAVG